jgi:SnoaL-like domain
VPVLKFYMLYLRCAALQTAKPADLEMRTQKPTTMRLSMPTTFETETAARQAHIDLLNRYAHAADGRNWPALAALFTEDGIFAARRLPGGGAAEQLSEEPDLSIEGPDKIVKFISTMLDTMRATHYMFSNYMVDVAAGGASAAASCYFRAYHVGKDERAHLYEESLGRFDLKTVRLGTQWKIRWMQESNMISLGTQEAWGAHPYLELLSKDKRK